jgi:hypothetical protein
MHSRWSPPGMDTVGFGSEVTGVAVFVAGVGNLGRSLTALPYRCPMASCGCAARTGGSGPCSAPADPTPDLLPTVTPH